MNSPVQDSVAGKGNEGELSKVDVIDRQQRRRRVRKVKVYHV